MEAEQLGSVFGPSEASRTFERHKQSLATWDRKEEQDEGALAARKRWKAIVERHHGANQWTKGEQYVRLWQEGIRPDYMPAVTTIEETPAAKKPKDHMNLGELPITAPRKGSPPAQPVA